MVHIKDAFSSPQKWCLICVRLRLIGIPPQQNVLFFQTEFGRRLCSLFLLGGNFLWVFLDIPYMSQQCFTSAISCIRAWDALIFSFCVTLCPCCCYCWSETILGQLWFMKLFWGPHLKKKSYIRKSWIWSRKIVHSFCHFDQVCSYLVSWGKHVFHLFNFLTSAGFYPQKQHTMRAVTPSLPGIAFRTPGAGTFVFAGGIRIGWWEDILFFDVFCIRK